MALQGVATPRFYVNVLEFLSESDVLVEYASFDDGIWTQHDYDITSLFRTLPVMPNNDAPGMAGVGMPVNIFHEQSFLAFLGHSEASTDGITIGISAVTDSIEINAHVHDGVDSGTLRFATPFDGFSIRSFDGTYGYAGNFPYPGSGDFFGSQTVFDFVVIGSTGEQSWNFFYNGSSIPGSLILGTYYDMPTSPNLSLKLSREYGGTTEVTTKNDTTYTNTLWNKAPKWGDLSAWELRGIEGGFYSTPNYRGTFETDQTLSKSGRRVWNLTFSYMDDRDLWGVSQIPAEFSGFSGLPDSDLLNTGYLESDLSSYLFDGFFELDSTLLKHDNFFSQVWHKTMGGTIPFIFQPDKDNSNPDQFAIARIRSNSLKATQTAFNVYDISLVIEEVW